MLDFSQGFSPATHLLVTLAAPLVGALAAWLLGHRGLQAVRQSAAVTSLITLGLAGSLVLRFLGSEVPSEGGFFAAGELGWFVNGPFDIRFSVGLDGLSIWLFGLSALLTVTAVFVSWDAVKEKAVGFYGLLLLLEAAMLGVFAARDIILFYVFFEFTLVPLFFLIGIWGHDDRRRAAVKFFIYTFAGSVLAFLGLLAIVLWNASHSGVLSFDIATLTAGLSSHPLPMTPEWGYLQLWVFLALFVGFAIKVPIVPVGIGGSANAMPRRATFVYPRKVHMVIGEPFSVELDEKGRASREALAAATERLHADLQVLFDRAQAIADPDAASGSAVQPK